MVKVIIVAAGVGNRLNPLTNDLPKCLLKIGDKTILERQLETLRGCGINDIVVVRGYKAEEINYPNIKYYFNDDYKKNNILASLFYAEKEMNDGFLFSYCDILYDKLTVEKLFAHQGDIVLAIDVNWRIRYDKRTMHPTDEAEFIVTEKGEIVKISKFLNPEIVYGEFIGLCKFSKRGAEILIRNYKRCLTNPVCGFKTNQRFHDAVSIEKAYLTDMLQELIERGYRLDYVDIDRGYYEIDTLQDLELVRKIYEQI